MIEPHIKEQASTIRRAVDRMDKDIEAIDIGSPDAYALYDAITDHIEHVRTEALRLEKWINE